MFLVKDFLEEVYNFVIIVVLVAVENMVLIHALLHKCLKGFSSSGDILLDRASGQSPHVNNTRQCLQILFPNCSTSSFTEMRSVWVKALEIGTTRSKA